MRLTYFFNNQQTIPMKNDLNDIFKRAFPSFSRSFQLLYIYFRLDSPTCAYKIHVTFTLLHNRTSKQGYSGHFLFSLSLAHTPDIWRVDLIFEKKMAIETNHVSKDQSKYSFYMYWKLHRLGKNIHMKNNFSDRLKKFENCMSIMGWLIDIPVEKEKNILVLSLAVRRKEEEKKRHSCTECIEKERINENLLTDLPNISKRNRSNNA